MRHNDCIVALLQAGFHCGLVLKDVKPRPADHHICYWFLARCLHTKLYHSCTSCRVFRSGSSFGRLHLNTQH